MRKFESATREKNNEDHKQHNKHVLHCIATTRNNGYHNQPLTYLSYQLHVQLPVLPLAKEIL